MIARRLADALDDLRVALAATGKTLDLSDAGLDAALAALEHRVLPRLQGKLPLIVGLCGGGNAGKSTLFNALAGGSDSGVGAPTGARAGLTRRALLAIPAAMLRNEPSLLSSLFEPFGGLPRPLADPDDLKTPGPPLYLAAERGLSDAILVDMPDFNVADNEGGYANRENAKAVLAACDLLVLLAGNETYKSRDTIDFMRATVADFGRRPSLLCYRFPPRTDPEGRLHEDSAEHIGEALDAMTALLYPGDAEPPILGRFLLVDDHDVRNRDAAPTVVLLPRAPSPPDGAPMVAGQGVEPLREVLARVDRLALHRRDLSATIGLLLDHAERFLGPCRERLAAVAAFRDGLDGVTRLVASTAFEAFPLQAFNDRLTGLWRARQNLFLRCGRVAGKWLSQPVRLLSAAAGRLFSGPSNDALPGEDPDAARSRRYLDALLRNAALVHADLLEKRLAPGRIHSAAVTWENVGQDRTLAMPPPYWPALERLEPPEYFRTEVYPALLEAGRAAASFPPDLDEIMAPHIDAARAAMSRSERLKEYAASAFQLALPVLALSYVALTWDPVSGAFIQATDVLAVGALPAAYGADRVAERWTRDLWRDVGTAWRGRQMPILENALKATLTGALLDAGREALRQSGDTLHRADVCLAGAGELFARWRAEPEAAGEEAVDG